jgi:murein DD-endopeptidase MepM/ murein hydrolase activator NlpD
MNADVKKILQSFDKILNENKPFINEAALNSPLDQTIAGSGFGQRWGKLHNGVDLAANAANVKAPADGVVVKVAADEYPCGGTIVIDHAGGFRTGYCHMQKINVSAGQQVKQGDIIGISGGGDGDPGRGKSNGRHLHFTLRKDGELVNPMDYINKAGVDLQGPVPTSSSSSSSSSSSELSSTSGTTTTPPKGNLDFKTNDTTFINNIANPLISQLKSGIKEESNEIGEILKSFEKILSENKSFVNEASATSNELLGGTQVKIPASGALAGQSGWQSGNAWDIAAAPNTPVYAIASGKVITMNDYGTDVTETKGKRLYGYGFTVDSENNLPDVYYTHLTTVSVKQGDNIKCGQFLGYVMKSPESVNYDHVHIGVETGHEITEFLNADGSLKCGGTITGSGSTSLSTSMSGTTTSTPKGNLDFKTNDATFANNIAGPLVSQLQAGAGIKEQTTKGKERFYLQFCNISQLSVKNGQQVSAGTLLGKTDNDVEVSKFDTNKTKVRLKKGDVDLGKNIKEYLGVLIIPKDSNTKIKSPVSGVVTTKYNSSCKNQITIEYYVGSDKVKDEKVSRVKDPTFSDPLMGAILTAPLTIFKDKYDDSGNLKQKRFGYAGERVDPWVKDAIVAPFKKIGDLYRKENKEEEERKKKKVQENIEKIKKLIK